MSEATGKSTWAECRLEDVCRLVNGRAYKRTELLDAGKYRVLRVGNLFTNGSWFWSDLELDSDKYIDTGDLIYAWSASFGPRIWHGEKVIYHYHIWKCLPDPALLNKHFLFRWFEWDTANIKADHGTGSTMIHVTKGDMEARPLSLPPLPEQKRIVAKLDRLSARTKAANAHLARVQSLATRAKQAILDSVFANGWPTEALSEFVDPERGIPYGIVQTGTDTPGGVPTVRCGDIKRFKIAADALKRVEPDISAAYGRTVLRGGEVLIAIRGSVGETCVAPPSFAGCNISREVALIPVLEGIDANFVMYFLQSRAATRFIKANIKGVAQTGINLRDLRTLPTPRLHEVEQLEIVLRIEAAFARIDRMVEDATRAAHLLDRLDQRLLAKAFRGELVAQDPNDEPAAELLARIEAARAAAPKPKRGRRQRA